MAAAVPMPCRLRRPGERTGSEAMAASASDEGFTLPLRQLFGETEEG